MQSFGNDPTCIRITMWINRLSAAFDGHITVYF